MCPSRQLYLRRRLEDERGPIEALWARLPATVRLELHCDSWATLPFVSMVDRVPVLAERRGGENFTDGLLASGQPLELSYQIECPAPGRLRFEGVEPIPLVRFSPELDQRLFRLLSDPRRLWSRYSEIVPKFARLFVLELFASRRMKSSGR